MSHSLTTQVNGDHNLWLKSLEFYKDEIRIFQKRLEEVSNKNNSPEINSQVEHFQNQFIVQRNNIDEIRHDVHHYTDELGSDIQQHPDQVNNHLLEEKKSLKEKYEDFERVMNGLRHEFNEFVAKCI